MCRILAVGMATALVAVAVVGCGSSDPRAAGTGSMGAASGGAGEDVLLVSVASSLAGAFGAIADEFGAATGVDVTLNVDASSSLVTQSLEGAPVDVIALADATSMQRLVDADALATEPVAVGATTLVIVTPPDNPASIASLADLATASTVALCAPEAPCGRYAAAALASAGVQLDESRVTRARNAGATLAAVADGDALAAVVYATDARAAGERVGVVALPEATDVVATSVMAATSERPVARAFIDWVLGPRGRAVLAEAGFDLPPETS